MTIPDVPYSTVNPTNTLLSVFCSVNMLLQHDHVILAAAQALGIIDVFEEKSPAFSSAIAIEIWSSIDGVEVKVDC